MEAADALRWTETETIGPQLGVIHRHIRGLLPGISRIAIALLDPKTDQLKTFVHSTDGASPLALYDAFYTDVPSLVELGRARRDRVVDDLSVFSDSPHEHSRRLLEAGYRSSYTTPFYDDGGLCGFLFFDSKEPAYFSRPVVERLWAHIQLIWLVVINGLLRTRMLRSAVRVASDLSHYRDPETGAHLDRMCRYSRLVAQQLAPSALLSDEFIEFLFLFSPLHDIGKIAIPDRILLKRGTLTAEEFEIMKTHTTKGYEIIDRLISDLGLAQLPYIHLLRNLTLHHHETVDGSGYPLGLAGEEIPIEARVIAVADVYDALTHERPYKQAWTQEAAFLYLQDRAGSKFDSHCCQALFENAKQLDQISSRFPDDETSRSQSREGYGLDL